MSGSNPQGAVHNFFMGDLPAPHRVPFWREVIGRRIAHIDIEFEPGREADANISLLALPGARMLWTSSNVPTILRRTNEQLVDGDDSFVFVMTQGARALRSQRGIDVAMSDGDAVGLLHNEPGSIQHLRHNGVMLLACP